MSASPRLDASDVDRLLALLVAHDELRLAPTYRPLAALCFLCMRSPEGLCPDLRFHSYRFRFLPGPTSEELFADLAFLIARGFIIERFEGGYQLIAPALASEWLSEAGGSQLLEQARLAIRHFNVQDPSRLIDQCREATSAR